MNDETISRFKVKLDMEETIAREPADEEEIGAVLKDLSFAKTFRDRSSKDPMPTEEQIRRSCT